MSRINIFPAVQEVLPNDRQLFTARAAPPPALWTQTGGADIKSDHSLEVDPVGSVAAAGGGHYLMSGAGVVEMVVDDQNRPTSTNTLEILGRINDTAGFQYIYWLKISSSTVKVFDEASTEIYTESYTAVSGDVYRFEFNAGFRFYRKNAGAAEFVLKHSRVGLATVVVYPQTYNMSITEATVAAPTRLAPPRLIGDWQLGSGVTWTAPSHGVISAPVANQVEYSGGILPGRYTLTVQMDPTADAGFGVQKATALIDIPTLEVLGPTAVTMLPGTKARFKTNYDEAQSELVAWSVVSGAGSFTQGEFTAGLNAGTTIVRAFADVNDQVVDITITVPTVITNSGGLTAAKVSEQIDFDHNIPPIPFLVSAGVPQAGSGSASAPLPAGYLPNDIFLLIATSPNEALTVSAWSSPNVGDSPQSIGTPADAAATRLHVFWKRAVLGEVAPTVLSGGDYVAAQILAFRGCILSGNPWDVTAGDTAASSASVSIPGGTTTVANCLIVAAVSNATDTATAQLSGAANASLANLAEVSDFNTTQGNGGGFSVITGEKAAAGAYSATTGTLATASAQARISLALKPEIPAWTASIGSINGTSGLWTAPSLAAQEAKIAVGNGFYRALIRVPVLEAFPRTDFKLPWPIDLVKRVLISEAEDGSRTSRVKGRARRSIPVELLVDAVEDVNGAGLATVMDFWDRHHPGAKFILEDPEEAVRLVVYSDSDLRWEHTGAGINIALRVKEAK